MLYDVAVIGAGVFGAWTAHHLRQAGLQVALLDAYGGGNSRASSGGESRIIRMGYGADEIYTRSSMRSLVLWQQFCLQTGQPLFHRTGVLWTAVKGDAYTENTRQTLARCGAHFEVLDPAALKSRFPQMHSAPGVWGIFEPESGALMARRAVEAVVADAVLHGVALLHEAVAQPHGKGALAAEVGLQVRHEKSSSYAFAGDVADDEAEPPLADIEEVEIIASHLASGKAQARVFESLGLGMDLRKKARLYLLGDFQFLSRTAFGFKLLGVRFLHGESARPARTNELPSRSSNQVKIPPQAGT